MKILLVNPPNCGRSLPEERYGIDSLKMILRGEPLSLEALAGNLEGHEVRIVDLKVEPDAFQDTLSEFQPRLVGITGVTCEANTVLVLAETAKRIAKAAVVVGGIHASNDPHFFNKPIVDYVVTGLGKKSFRELVNAMESGGTATEIPGIGRTNPSGFISITPRVYSVSDLVEENPPRYDLVVKYRGAYQVKPFNFPIGLVSTAFGCPYRCSFCSIGNVTGQKYLTCTIENILRDILLLEDIPLIRLVDANTFGSSDHSWKLCKAIQDSGIRKNFVADVRSDTVVRRPDLFAEWKKAGLRSVIVGFEEIDDGNLAGMNKSNTTAVNSESIRILHEIGITIVGDFIVSPDYDEARFDALQEYIETNRVDLPMLSVMTPLPGTPLYESMKDKIVIHDLDFYTLTNAVTPTRMNEKEFYTRYANLMISAHGGAKL